MLGQFIHKYIYDGPRVYKYNIIKNINITPLNVNLSTFFIQISLQYPIQKNIEKIVRLRQQQQLNPYKSPQRQTNMGGKQSQPGQEERQEIPKVNHPKFKNIKFTRNKDDEDCIEVKIPVANIKEYNTWVQLLKDAPMESENFLLPQKHDFQKEGFCGSSGYVNVLFQNFPYVLADQIGNRDQLKQKFFEQPELWYLIYTLLSAGHEFHKNGKKVGDVRPQNVFINEDGQVKVATQLTWPSENVNYHKTFFQKETTYLAPEQLKDIQFAKMEPTCDPKLAESFSVGLTCLDAGTLSSSNDLYLKGSKFDYNKLSQKLQELQNAGYSQILCLVVSNLCEPDSDRRSTCSELYKWLEPHQENIINLQRFEVNSLPQKFNYQNEHQQHLEQRPGSSMQQSFQQRPGVVPETVTYSNYSPQQPNGYINGGQNIQHYSVPPPQVFQGGQTVTYYQVPVQQQPIPGAPTSGQTQPKPQQLPQVQPQPQVKPQPQSQLQFQQGEQVVYYNHPPQPGQPGQLQNKITDNRTSTTTSTYTYTQYPQAQYIPGANIGSTTQYTTTQVSGGGQFSRPVTGNFQAVDAGDSRPKSNMELTLEKIDEQLQMSRKMFPS